METFSFNQNTHVIDQVGTPMRSEFSVNEAIDEICEDSQSIMLDADGLNNVMSFEEQYS